jgi:Rad3-related DNA helicase
VGIPQLCFERDLIKEIFDAKGESGYDYAYRFPGFNRVLQASGRVIRSEKDRGFVMLLDRRFLEKRYTQMFPSFWKKLYIAKSPDKAGELTEKFWNQWGSV